MNDQIRISDTGELEVAPTTWDGEPLYSPHTVQEGLFASEAFQQMKGQISMDTDEFDGLTLVYCACCHEDFYTDTDAPSPYCASCLRIGR
jgi:hypothetical protein